MVSKAAEKFFGIDEDDSDEDEKGSSGIRINKKFAGKYEERKRREELQRGKDLLDEDEDDESSSSDEDEDAELLTTAIDKDILKTITAIRSKDPSIYDAKKDWFAEKEASDGQTKAKKTKKMTVSDVIREQTLDKMNRPEGEADPEGEGDDSSEEDDSDAEMTYDEEQAQLKRSFMDLAAGEDSRMGKSKKKGKGKAQAEESEESEEEEEEEEEDLFEVKSKSDAQKRKEAQADKEDKELVRLQKKYDVEQKTLEKNLGGNKEAVVAEQFLHDFLTKKRWKDEDADGDEEEEEEEDESYMDKQDNFEQKYNFRFEEEGGGEIMTYSRNTVGSLRRKDVKRKTKREERKERKAEEKKQKQQELRRLKNLKKQEVMDRLAKVSKISGIKHEMEEEEEEEGGGEWGEEGGKWAEEEEEEEDEGKGKKGKKSKKPSMGKPSGKEAAMMAAMGDMLDQVMYPPAPVLVHVLKTSTSTSTHVEMHSRQLLFLHSHSLSHLCRIGTKRRTIKRWMRCLVTTTTTTKMRNSSPPRMTRRSWHSWGSMEGKERRRRRRRKKRRRKRSRSRRSRRVVGAGRRRSSGGMTGRELGKARSGEARARASGPRVTVRSRRKEQNQPSVRRCKTRSTPSTTRTSSQACPAVSSTAVSRRRVSDSQRATFCWQTTGSSRNSCPSRSWRRTETWTGACLDRQRLISGRS
jgi:protein KRI1